MLLNNKGKQTFDQIAGDYDAVRPLYPDELCTYLAQTGNWQAETRILEIGCGTGQLTRNLSKYNFQIHAIDIGEQLVSLARKHCSGHHRTTFTVTPFEEFQATPGSFDTILAATSFHWLDADLRFTKTAELLREGGQLFIINNVSKHREQEGSLRQALDRVYEKVIPPDITKQYISLEKQSGNVEDEFAECPLFGPLQLYSHRHIHTLSSDDYLRLLNTFSYQHNLPEPVKSTLFQQIRQAVEDHGGLIHLPYETRVMWAVKC
ncbi:MAG: class I SAM-dependent methyltransferase [Saprospiraceae bacterium]|nr:class I SAM-dependent methyltransferase [Lewinella sp.]